MIEAVDLRRLQSLRMVHEHGTVTAAAAALHLTPSAVSHQLRQLAQEVGVALLEPDGRRVRLTAAGQRLVRHADDLLANWERVAADLESLAKGEVGLLRLCGFTTAVAGLLAPVADVLADTAPGLHVYITEVEDGSDGFDMLLAGTVDIALVTPVDEGPPLDDARYDQQPLLTEPVDLLVPVDHPLAGRQFVSLREAADDQWILAAPDSWDCRQLAVAACTAAGFSPRLAHEAHSPLAVAALVARGLGIAAVPRLTPVPADLPVSRVTLAGDPPPQRQILTCVRRGSDTHPAIARGLDTLRSVAMDLSATLSHTADPGTVAHDLDQGHLRVST